MITVQIYKTGLTYTSISIIFFEKKKTHTTIGTGLILCILKLINIVLFKIPPLKSQQGYF